MDAARHKCAAFSWRRLSEMTLMKVYFLQNIKRCSYNWCFFFPPPCLELAVVELSIWCFPPPFGRGLRAEHQRLRVLSGGLWCTSCTESPRRSILCCPLPPHGLGLGLRASPAHCGCCFGVFWMWMWSSLSVLCFARILFLKNKAVAMK